MIATLDSSRLASNRISYMWKMLIIYAITWRYSQACP